MNRENLTNKQIDLISLLGHVVILRGKNDEILKVGRLDTHKDEIGPFYRVEKTLIYFSVTPNNGEQWVFRADELFAIDSQAYVIWLNW